MLGDSGYERIDADAYFTPPENVDCLSQFVTFPSIIWEPACGSGNITQRLQEFGHEVISSDLHDYGFEEQIGTFDFLAAETPPTGCRAIVTNPPYGDLVEKFIRHGLKLMKPKGGIVALFLRNEYDCGKNRMDLFGQYPVLQEDRRHQAAQVDRRVHRQSTSQLRLVRLGFPPAG
jgi:hypothetical protein